VSERSFYDREAELAAIGEVSTNLVEGVPVWLAILGPRKSVSRSCYEYVPTEAGEALEAKNGPLRWLRRR
jgi:hypothetical protein